MPVIIGGNSIRPAPQVTFQVGHDRTGDGRMLGNTVRATLRGTIVTDKVDDTDTPHTIETKLATVLAKQQQLRDWFAADGVWLEVQGWDGSAPTKFMVQNVESIEFDPGLWVERCDYTIELSGQSFADGNANTDHVESATESWQFEEAEGPHTYRGTHTVQVKGKKTFNAEGTFDKAAWQYAKTFAISMLGLDWTTTKTPWSAMAGSDMWTGSSVLPDASTPYNRVVTESIDELEGTYAVTETFFISNGPYWEEYTVSTRKVTDDPTMTLTVGLNGTIHGLTTSMHDPEGKTANAIARWLTVKTLLLTRAQSYVIGSITLNANPSSISYDYNTTEGTVSYQYEYNDRKLTNDTFEFYNVAMQTGVEDSHTLVTVEGTITGVRYGGDVDPGLKFTRARAQWELVKLTLLARAIAESGITDLKPFPVSANVTPNAQDGSMNYSYSFDNRNPEGVRHEFVVSKRYSREDGRTLVSIDGTVTGLRTIAADHDYPFTTYDPNERYAAALAYYQGISGNLFGLIGNYVDASKVNPQPYTTAVGHNQYGGQVTYQLEFNSIPAPCIAGALSENITVTDDAAVPVVAVIPVMGRAKGPVIQNMGTVREKRRSVTIEIVMPVDMSTDICGSSSMTPPLTVDISPYAPSGSPVYLETDQTQWSPSTGHFLRQCSWLFE